MGQQVRVATDRRGEVGVRLVIQTEVALIVGAVHRLTQRTQHHGLDQVVVVTPTNGFQQRLVILRRRTFFGLATVQRQAQLGKKCLELFQTLRRRTIVHAVQRRNFMLLHKRSGGHVGRQHALLDQLVSIVALSRTNFRDLAPSTEDDPGFLGFKIDSAALMTGSQQYLVQRVQLLEMRQHLAVLAAQGLAFRALGLLKHGADLVVGQPRMGVNHRLVELVIGHFAGFRHGHFTDHCQPVNLRIQRAQTVGQLLRQHRHHAFGEVH